MNWKSIITIITGIILALLGILWFLQGSDLIHLKPILCFTDCEPVIGKSLQWQYAGIIAFMVGTVIIGISIKRISRHIIATKGKPS